MAEKCPRIRPAEVVNTSINVGKFVIQQSVLKAEECLKRFDSEPHPYEEPEPKTWQGSD